MAKELDKKVIALTIKRNSVETPSGCWEWQGVCHVVGYPALPERFGGGRYGHRAMFAAIVCPIPKGMYVLHTCDNRKCVNPEHLFLGTHLDNIKDMHAKGRQRGGSMKGEKNPFCKFSDSTIAKIRADYVNGIRKCDIENKYGISETHYYNVVNNHKRTGVNHGF